MIHIEHPNCPIQSIFNGPIEDRLDWTVGMFYMDHEIENVIRGYRDDDLDGRLKYLCDASHKYFSLPSKSSSR